MLAAQLTTLPVILVNFERLSLVAPIANVLVVPKETKNPFPDVKPHNVIDEQVLASTEWVRPSERRQQVERLV